MDLEVVGLGYCCVDDLLLLTEIPGPEGRATIVARDRQGGGMAATALVTVARLGGRAGFVAKVGDDPTGTWILDDFRRQAVDVGHAVVVPGATSHLTVVLVDGGSGARAFLSQRGDVEPLAPAELDRAYLTQGAILHLSDASEAAVQAARWAKEAGKEVSFDGTHFHPSVLDIVPYVDYLIVSRFFASEFAAHRDGRDLGRAARDFSGLAAAVPAAPIPPAAPGAPTHPAVARPAGAVEPLAGEALLLEAERLRALGPAVTVVTEGEHGCWCAATDGSFHVPAWPAQPVDTTGAGDVFHGAFAFARARGWDLRDALTIASATASLKCRALGGRAGIPTLEEVRTLVHL